jgi:hypothetical protein
MHTQKEGLLRDVLRYAAIGLLTAKKRFLKHVPTTTLISLSEMLCSVLHEDVLNV